MVGISLVQDEMEVSHLHSQPTTGTDEVSAVVPKKKKTVTWSREVNARTAFYRYPDGPKVRK